VPWGETPIRRKTLCKTFHGEPPAGKKVPTTKNGKEMSMV
jgi:hypothetical protein